jgi:2-keto-4-pentenoate hydratase/2-oxohepta-3-ene-1,7-dioic acid hydratase in catechol pathway
MRIARYVHQGEESFGFVIGDGIVDRSQVSGLTAATVRELIAGPLPAADAIEAGTPTPLSEVTLLPPVELHKVICAGVNFATHRAEAHMAVERPDHPTIFTRFPDSHVGSGDAIVKPANSERFDYEGELAVVIGERAWQVSEQDALAHVFGYSCYDDGSARDWQTHTQQWIPGKNFYRSGSIGPFLVTADEVGEIDDSWLTTRVNGDERQHAQIRDMVFSIAELVAYASSFTPLEPGDVIAAGTPGGVGLFMEPKTFLSPGDVVEVEIDRVGLLRNQVA